MSYKEELSRIIKSSGLSLREIASRCQSMGVSISHSYISQLQRGKLPPPKEEVSLAICQVCDAECEDLLIYGYFDKSPDIIKEYINSCSKVNLKLALTLNEMSKDKISPDMIENMNLIRRLDFTTSKGWKLQNQFKGHENIIQDAFNTTFAEKKDSIFMKDSSMEPLIPKDSLLKIEILRGNKKGKIHHEPANGEIIAFFDLSGEEFVRRYQEIDGSILLKPENNRYDIISITSLEQINIRGKVVTYSKGIN